MSSDHYQKPYTQRFKGVETFLRRVAFNLGNTASQTEVKIISCIPIDVTDLQQKIINLEKQLHEAQHKTATIDEKVTVIPKVNPSVVNTALYGSPFAKQSSMVSYCSNKPIDKIKSTQVTTYCGDCSKSRKSNVSFIFPALSAPDTEHDYKISTHKDNSKENTAAIDRCKNIFKKRKRKKDYKGNNKMKTHLVYYAHQTADNPFKINDVPLKYHEILSNNDELCISHLNNIIRRQYDPNEVVEEFSDTSNFSRPICRDVGDKYKHFKHYESDVCSCCHDKFQNIDNYMTKTDYDSILTKLHNSLDNIKVYYDSNQYDVIPVKENSKKLIKNNVDQNKGNEMNVEIKCWPEQLRSKRRYHPFIVNYQTKKPVKRRPDKRSERFLPEKIKPQKCTNRDKIKMLDQHTNIETSKSCCIDCSDIYPKQYPQQVESRKNEIQKTILQKNESVATDDVVIKLQIKNQSTQLELDAAEDCRDNTLNQIKTILQSVLEEVKTSSKLNSADEVVKRDAIVQKGPSQNSMPGESTLLHSYTYNNSYNTNTYSASCSKQIPHGQYCLASVPFQPVKCLQNFPVFIQPVSGRHLCACHYRKSSYKPQNKQTTATANTDKKVEVTSSKETEKLIKEIYKSMALNMDFPTKDSSTSEYNDLKSSENVSTNTIEVNNKKVSNKRYTKVEAIVSPIQSIMNQNELDRASVNTKSEDRKQVIKSNFNKAESTGNINKDTYVNRLELHSIRSSDTIVEDEEETDEISDESDSDETVIVEEEYKQNRKPKKGFFNRIFKSVKLFKKKKEIQEEKNEASDSDDYETICSEKSIIPTKPYTKEKTLSPDYRNRKGTPYLEQEYRRQWNEKLTFHEQESKCSSERPISRYSSPKHPRTYWNNYEARSVIIDHKLPKCEIIHARKEQETLQRNKLLQNSNKERLGWLKKHKLGINCGEQWKKFILEN